MAMDQPITFEMFQDMKKKFIEKECEKIAKGIREEFLEDFEETLWRENKEWTYDTENEIINDEFKVIVEERLRKYFPDIEIIIDNKNPFTKDNVSTYWVTINPFKKVE